jgi:hypothetical protein
MEKAGCGGMPVISVAHVKRPAWAKTEMLSQK